MLVVDHRANIIEDNIHHNLDHNNGILANDHLVLLVLDNPVNGNTIDILHKISNNRIHPYNR